MFLNCYFALPLVLSLCQEVVKKLHIQKSLGRLTQKNFLQFQRKSLLILMI